MAGRGLCGRPPACLVFWRRGNVALPRGALGRPPRLGRIKILPKSCRPFDRFDWLVFRVNALFREDFETVNTCPRCRPKLPEYAVTCPRCRPSCPSMPSRVRGVVQVARYAVTCPWCRPSCPSMPSRVRGVVQLARVCRHVSEVSSKLRGTVFTASQARKHWVSPHFPEN